MEKKTRIQLFTQDGGMVSDRLVSQDGELYNGPKLKHDGPVRVEFTIFDQKDLESVKEYLEKLKGEMPLDAKPKKKKVLKVSDKDSREDFLKEVLEQCDDQEQLVQALRKEGFVFITTEFFQASKDFNLNLKSRHKHYQWMVRLMRRAKNPRSDRYDPMLAFGINVFNPNDKVVYYLNGEYKGSKKIDLPANPTEVVKKSKLLKFPPYMEHDERDKFRVELRTLQEDKERKQSKFFKRWAKWVENLPEEFVDNSQEEEENPE